MRRPGIHATCAALVFAMLGGCRSLKSSPSPFAAGTLVATLLRSTSGTPVGKATIGIISGGAMTPTYYLEIEVCYHGQNEVTATPGTPSPHAVHFDYATSTGHPINTSIPLDFQSISGPLGHNVGYVKIPIDVNQYNSIHESDYIMISSNNVNTGADLISGEF